MFSFLFPCALSLTFCRHRCKQNRHQIDQTFVPEDCAANFCFGGKDRHTLFITASRSVYTLKMRVHGVGSQ